MSNGPDVAIHSPFTEGVIGNMAELGNDSMELIELQAELASQDLRECLKAGRIYLVLAVIAVLLLLGMVPIALAGTALLIEAQSGLSLGTSLLVSAGGALLAAALGLPTAAWGMRRSLRSFDRSRAELSRNVAWIKKLLSSTSQPPPPPRRGRGLWTFPR